MRRLGLILAVAAACALPHGARAQVSTSTAGVLGNTFVGTSATLLFAGTVRGGYVANGLTATDEQIAAAEQVCISLALTTPTLVSAGGNYCIQPGGSFNLPTGVYFTLYGIAATANHRVAGAVW